MIDPLGGWANAWPLAVGFFIAYLIGAIPFGLLLAKFSGAGDIRKIGSGNIGATNVLRTGRKGLAAATLLLDAGKGWVAVWLGWRYGGPDMAVLAAYGALLGHCFPVWLLFKGGKGVATFLGAVTGLSLIFGAACALAWLAAAAAFRISSVAGLLLTAAAPITAYFNGDQQLFEATLAMAVLVWLRHWQNIRRLIKGDEPRIGKGG
jgi:glycerol-3-phosphate acyltransferase PlsY